MVWERLDALDSGLHGLYFAYHVMGFNLHAYCSGFHENSDSTFWSPSFFLKKSLKKSFYENIFLPYID